MKLRIQGETYDSPGEVLTAIGELSAQLEDLPESHPGRADLERHIERLKSAVASESGATVELAPESAVDSVADESPNIKDDPPPEPKGETPEEEDEDDNVPPGFQLCPVCRGGGLLTEDAPVSNLYERCNACNGFGKVLTGSHVPGHEQKDCETCNGEGYHRRESTATAQTNGNVAAPAALYPGAVWNAEAQLWDPPHGEKPWSDAKWDALIGAYV